MSLHMQVTSLRVWVTSLHDTYESCPYIHTCACGQAVVACGKSANNCPQFPLGDFRGRSIILKINPYEQFVAFQDPSLAMCAVCACCLACFFCMWFVGRSAAAHSLHPRLCRTPLGLPLRTRDGPRYSPRGVFPCFSQRGGDLSSNVSFNWNVAKETFELWALSFEF